MEAAFSNAEKLAAVLEYWAAPRLRQLLPAYGNLITSAIKPVVMAWARKVPDESLPGVAAEVVERAKALGVVRVWKVEIDRQDLAELDGLLHANLPYEKQPSRCYEVKRAPQTSCDELNGGINKY